MAGGAQVLVSLGQASSGGANPAALRQSVPQDTVTGLFRDLRGIAIATNSRRTYGALALPKPSLERGPSLFFGHLTACYGDCTN